MYYDDKQLQNRMEPVYDIPQTLAGMEVQMELKENVCYAKL